MAVQIFLPYLFSYWWFSQEYVLVNVFQLHFKVLKTITTSYLAKRSFYKKFTFPRHYLLSFCPLPFSAPQMVPICITYLFFVGREWVKRLRNFRRLQWNNTFIWGEDSSQNGITFHCSGWRPWSSHWQCYMLWYGQEDGQLIGKHRHWTQWERKQHRIMGNWWMGKHTEWWE